jgi:thioredoxin reductase (NADPH)
MTENQTQCLIIGSGPAGYTAAIYAARAEMKPIIFEGVQPGGQLTITTEIENFPGFPSKTTGTALMESMKQQALHFHADIRTGNIVKVDFSSQPFKAWSDSEECIEAKTIIIATGASARWLGLESETIFRNGGISACATCDGFFYKGKDVAVVGGGDTACEEATYLAKLCRKVYLIHRRNELRASKAMQKRVFETPNIEMIWDSRIVDFYGVKEQFNALLEGIKIENLNTLETKDISLEGVFIAIGHQPNSDIFKRIIDMDEAGYIKTLPNSTATNIPGIFAAGDIQDKKFRQAITAAASGCMAAIEAERFFLNER